MMLSKWRVACVILAAISLFSCSNRKEHSGTAGESSATSPAARGGGEAGVEKVKPAPGTGNVQGKVLYNSKPVENIDVKLCEKFSRYLSGCGGQTYTARTD